jgi:DNA-binding HxlR family transcriptional regulator
MDELAATPLPSEVPRPEGIFDPVARALDVVGDRWTLVLISHLMGGDRGFQDLRRRTGITPRVLSGRLRQLAEAGFIETISEGSRSLYTLTPHGCSLEPVVTTIGRWWIRNLSQLDVDARAFTETSARSVIESLPFMVREERARGIDLTFELRLTGVGGGVWSIRIHDGRCDIEAGFATRADVRYTADAQDWCALALGLEDGRELFRSGRLVKEGGRTAMDHFFHQVSTGPGARTDRGDET